jgi:hypothetical protein
LGHLTRLAGAATQALALVASVIIAGGLPSMCAAAPQSTSRERTVVRAAPLSEHWESDWKFEAKGKFTGWSDHRGIYSFRHPYEESQTGDYAQVSREVEVPADWSGPLTLSLLATDDHHGTGYDPVKWPHYVGADIFVGHRFNQVLVNGEVIWEQDVAESDSPDWTSGEGSVPYSGFYQTADLTGKVKPGQKFTLTLRVYDKVGSGTVLPGDVHQGHYWEPASLDRTKANKWFDFTGWWGDVTLTTDANASGVRRTYADRIALKPVAEPQASAAGEVVRVTMPIARADTLPAVAYPLGGGVPFPKGLVTDAGQIRLLDANGAEAPCQVEIVSRWAADGSAQWAWISAMAQPGQKAFTMECGRGVKRVDAASPLTVDLTDGVCSIGTGAARVVLAEGGTDLIRSLRVGDGPECGPVTGVLHQQMLGSLRGHKVRVKKLTIEEGGPVRVSVKIDGELSDDEGHVFGPFEGRVLAWAGSPLISLSHRVFQNTDQLVAIVDDMMLEVAAPFAKGTLGSFTPATFDRPLPEGQVRELELRQPHTATYDYTAKSQNFGIIGKRSEVLESGAHAPGWVDMSGQTADGKTGGIATGVRWFWQLAPKSLTVTEQGLLVGLFARRQRDDWALDSPLWMVTRGEAKRHYVWLMPHDGGAKPELLDQVQRAWDARPHLMSGEWVARTGVLGNFAQHNAAAFPEIDTFLRQWDKSELGLERYGIHDFRETAWCQNYRGRAANGLLEYFESGRGEWQDYFEQVMGHNLDVDTIHYDPEHPGWVGAIRDYSPYHTTGGPSYGINSNCQDQFLHYYFAGERDSLAEAKLAAEHIAAMPGNQGRSARQEGWPMAQMSIAYMWTGDAKYKASAEDFFRFAELYTHPRRGAYDETHSSFSNRGIVPFMTGYLGFGLMRYHEATGDERAAKLIAALTEATVSETSDGKGGFWYSPCPSGRGWGSTAWTTLIGAMCSYSYRVTGDRWFAEQAQLCYTRLTTDPQASTSLDMAPTMGELLAGLELAKARGDLK